MSRADVRGPASERAFGDLSSLDIAIVVLLTLATAFYLSPFVNPGWQIYEDAAMLFRYAQHVSAGHGIVWNVGDYPVDGATDLLFMWMIAGLHTAGIGIETSARVISAVSHIATVVLIFITLRTLGCAGRVAAVLSSAYVAVGPGKAYVAGGFGTPVFVMCVAVAWFATLRLALKPSTGRAVACGCASVLMGVARPEGALLAVFSAIALLIFWKENANRRFIWPLILTGAAIGGAYWLWRWLYFGYPLPNPFYRKGNGRLFYGNLLVTAKYGALHLGPFLVPLVAGLMDRRLRRTTLLAAVPIAAFLASWILLSNEMNFFRRFQYPVVPIAAMSWPLSISGRAASWWTALHSGSTLRRSGVAVMAFLATIAILTYQHWTYFPPRWQDQLFQLGVTLEPYHDRGYTMAVSEAGLLPFYSEWRAIDVWGLNDQWIAHHGIVTAPYLDRQAPDLVMFRARCRPLTDRDPDPWSAMVRVLTDYVRDRPYTLSAGIEQGDGSLTLFYLRRGFRDEGAVDAVLRRATQSHSGSPHRLADCGDGGLKTAFVQGAR